MKYMVVALLAVVAVSAMPNVGPHEGHHGGIPFYPLLATQHQNSAMQGAGGFANGLHAFGAQNFGLTGASNTYDRGAEESSYSTMTNAHQKSSHDRGGSQHFGLGSSSMGGLDQHSAGYNQFAGLNSQGSSVLAG